MNYKTITIIDKTEVKDGVTENSMELLRPYIDKGYKILNFSCSSNIAQNVSQADLITKPTNLVSIITYLLAK